MDISAVMKKYKGCTIIQDIAYCISKLSDTGNIIFGSDNPNFSPFDTYKALEKIAKKKHVSRKQIENIMGDNIKKIMELRK